MGAERIFERIILSIAVFEKEVCARVRESIVGGYYCPNTYGCLSLRSELCLTLGVKKGVKTKKMRYKIL